ncbi:MAG: hypothetical protein NXI10_05690 [bacterium]|nr:hypothetical protein [bacterium]
MTTMIGRLGKKMSNQAIVIIGLMFLSSGVNAQLDTASVSSVSFAQETVTDSLTLVTDTLDIMNVEVFMDDIDFLGEVLVTVYDQATGYPLQMVKQTKSELELNDLIIGSFAKIEIFGLEPNVGLYNIDVQVRNFQGGNLPLLSAQY